MKNIIIISLIFIFFYQCTFPTKDKPIELEGSILLKFKSLEKESTSILKDISFVNLETKEECLIGNINQISVFNEYIYILSDDGLYIFDLNGIYKQKIENSGNGPGEFITPYSFWIDNAGFIFILDRQLSRLLKYDIENLSFLESIVMPYESPLSFAKMPDNDTFIYYYPLRPGRGIENKQIFIADKHGTIQSSIFDGDASGKILHGNNSNFYIKDDKLRFYPYFSNKVYTIDNNNLYETHRLSFKDHNFPNQEIFTKYDNSGDIMKEILIGNHKWIRLIYIYETDANLSAKYYIEKDLYVSNWNKNNGQTINFKYDEVVDDIGIGGGFPLPIGVYDNRIIGIIRPYDLEKELVKNTELKKILENSTEEDNPIIVFYSFKS